MNDPYPTTAVTEPSTNHPQPNPRKPFSLGVRILLALLLTLLLAGAAAALWIFGILMFTFSLDSANSNDLPDWLDGFMLIGWPATLVAFVVIPPTLFAFGKNLTWIAASTVITGLISAAVFMTGVVSMHVAIAN